MSYQARVLQLMIASPSDVVEERQIVAEEVQRWNDAHSVTRKLVVFPVRWETHSTPQLRDTAQTVLNEQLLQSSDIVVGIFGTRIGTPTAEYISGSVEEIRRHVDAGKTTKVYFSDAPVQPSSINSDQYALVKLFKEECQQKGLYASYADTDKFRRTFKQHLDIELNEARYLSPDLGKVSVSTVRPDAPLSETAKSIIRAAEGTGEIIHAQWMGGEAIRAGEKEIIEDSVRSRANARAALKDLLAKGFLEKRSDSLYELTDRAYVWLDADEREKPTSITLRTDGEPDKQQLVVSSTRPLEFTKLDYLNMADVCIASFNLTGSGTEHKIPLVNQKLGSLPSANNPNGKIRLIARDRGRSIELVLPIALQLRLFEASALMVAKGEQSYDI